MALNPYANPFIPRKRFVQGGTYISPLSQNAQNEPTPAAPLRSDLTLENAPSRLGKHYTKMFEYINEQERDKKLKSDFPVMKSVVNRHALPETIAKGIAYPLTGSITNNVIRTGTSLIGGAVNGIRDLIDRPKQEALQAANRLEQEKLETRQRLMTSQSQGRYVSYK